MTVADQPLNASLAGSTTEALIAIEDQFGAHNYHPLGLIIEEAQGAWVTDVEGKRYLDCLSAYSAVNQGHCHPKILETLIEQAKRVTLTSRAFRNDQLPLFCKELAAFAGMDRVIPMNSGAEAVETAIKAARKWGYTVKGIPMNQATIVVASNNFHGRTSTIVGFSTEKAYNAYFGPYGPGFRIAEYGCIDCLDHMLAEDTAAFMVEPIQGEAGIIIPPEGYLKAAEKLCKERNILFIVDEIQVGLGRTGKRFCYEHEGLDPDAVIVGKALSGGFYPVSAVISKEPLLSVFTPGEHGSTFGGNPLACAVARTALQVLEEENLIERSATLGASLLAKLQELAKQSPVIKEVRGRGLLIGLELRGKARPYCEQLKERGLLCKETHDNVLRISPPLVVSQEDLDWAFEQLKAVLTQA